MRNAELRTNNPENNFPSNPFLCFLEPFIPHSEIRISPMSSVTLTKLVKTYPASKGPDVTVVHGIDLEIRNGEFMVLVGPSGCGKSTTLRMIAGLEDITAGEIFIDGRVVNHIAPKDRDIAMVFQNYALYPHMSVYENMAFGLKLRGFPKNEIDTRVREAAAMLGLAAYLERKPKALSGGQRQRVAVGRAIVRKPKVFLFDEPLSNLDAKMRVSMRTEISKLHARLGATMIYVTHDQTEAMTMGDRICVMKDGRIMQVDEPLALYNRPANLFTAGFIGSPQMNFLQGELHPENAALYFVAQTSNLPTKRSAAGLGGMGDSPMLHHPSAVPLRIQLPAHIATPARAYAGRPVTLGIRPEHIRETAPDEHAHLDATIDISEPMGSETYLYLTAAGTSFIARVGPHADYASGRRIPLTFDLAHAHLFDSETGATL